MEFIKKLNDKAKLKSCFRAAELFKTRTVSNNKYEIFPEVHSIKYDNPTTIVFTLPNGVNPNLIKKNDYVFKQYFGESIEIKGELKKFILKIYKKPVGSVKYSFKRYADIAKEKGMKLPILCGDQLITGKPILFDMAERPHILNGGETGGGKSTWLLAVITFLIEYLPPEKLDLYLCDLGAVEFVTFQNVQHVKKPIAIEIENVVKIFDELKTELNKRKKLMIKHRVRHVDDLPESIPYKVCFVDEFHNLKGNDEVMDKLMSIAAEGRKLGVFLVLTTQRPSAALVNGDIKANLTVSMAFKTKNRLNSNMILDAGAPNAAELKGKGHGIVSIDDYYEIQTPDIKQKDVEKIIKNYKKDENDITDLVEIVDVDEDYEEEDQNDIKDIFKKISEEDLLD